MARKKAVATPVEYGVVEEQDRIVITVPVGENGDPVASCIKQQGTSRYGQRYVTCSDIDLVAPLGADERTVVKVVFGSRKARKDSSTKNFTPEEIALFREYLAKRSK